MKLQNFDHAAFLRDTWQRCPCVIRQAWPDWTNPLAPDDLAGLACEAEIESRLVTRKPKKWQVEHGPFEAARFGKAGKHPWTLLVQAVDHYVPEVAVLLAPFRFIPNWRIDDVMVSYASDGGGVGPHFDQYDVFLVQGLGRRRWQVGALCNEATALLPNDDIKLLASFEATDEWVLEPGDMLYVPPGYAHDGVAIGGGCMTYSVGFRAPSRSELIAGWSDEVLAELSDDDRFGDAGLVSQANPGEITADALDALHAMVKDKLMDRAAFARWFGGYTTEPKYPEIDWQPDVPVALDAVRAALGSGVALLRNPASRFAFVREGAGAVTLFVDGESFSCEREAAILAERVCASDRVVVSESGAEAAALIQALIDQGAVSIEVT